MVVGVVMVVVVRGLVLFFLSLPVDDDVSTASGTQGTARADSARDEDDENAATGAGRGAAVVVIAAVVAGAAATAVVAASSCWID